MMEDLIKREDAIQAALERIDHYTELSYAHGSGMKHRRTAMREFLKDLKDIPPAENKGEWIEEIYLNGHTYGTCSNCLHVRIQDNYCPNCGARMIDKDIDIPYKIASDQRDYDSTYEPTYNEQDGSM